MKLWGKTTLKCIADWLSLSVFLLQSVPDASPMKRSASTVTPQRPQEVNLRDYTLEKPSQERTHHHHRRCHHRRDRDRDRDRENRQRSLDAPLAGQPPGSAGKVSQNLFTSTIKITVYKDIQYHLVPLQCHLVPLSIGLSHHAIL